MPNDKFFDDDDGGSNPIKIDDNEYSIDELKELVKYGKLGKEVEEKHNTKIDRLMPEYTKATQELKALREQLAEYESKSSEQQRPAEDGELTPEQRASAIKQAQKLGIITTEDAKEKLASLVEEKVNSILAGRDLLGQVKSASSWAKEEYGIDVTNEDILEYMRDTGINNPKRALKDKFEEQIDKAKQQKWLESKAPEFRTLSQQSMRKEPLSPDFRDRDKVKKMAIEQMLGGDH